MHTEVGHIEAIFRYPVKSMRGEQLESAELGWHGIEGDRRLALRRLADRSGFPWLTGSKFPELILFTPLCRDNDGEAAIPTHVRTPDGKELPIFGAELAAEIARRYGSPVEMLQMRHGIFDDASVSVIAADTVREIAQLSGYSPDVRRFRPNILVRLHRPAAFQEENWLSGALTFGDAEDAPTVSVTQRDIRCAMVNLDPETGKPDPEVLKAVVRVNHTVAGVYGTVTRTGRIAVGQAIHFHATTSAAAVGQD